MSEIFKRKLTRFIREESGLTSSQVVFAAFALVMPSIIILSSSVTMRF